MYNGIEDNIRTIYTFTLSHDGNTIKYATLIATLLKEGEIPGQKSFEESKKLFYINLDRNEIKSSNENIQNIADTFGYKLKPRLIGKDYKVFLELMLGNLETIVSDRFFIKSDDIIYVPDQKTKDILKQEFDKEGIKREYVSDDFDTSGEIIEKDILKRIKPFNRQYKKNLGLLDLIKNANDFHKEMLDARVIACKKYNETLRIKEIKEDF
jgi:hypothetical protein